MIKKYVNFEGVLTQGFFQAFLPPVKHVEKLNLNWV